MTRNFFIRALFICIAIICTGTYLAHDFYQATKVEVKTVLEKIAEIDEVIAIVKKQQKTTPDDPTIRLKLEKLYMERVLLPLPWVLQMELVENGVWSLASQLLVSADSRRKALREIVFAHSRRARLEECPIEFRRLFEIYASEKGYGLQSLDALRKFAREYGKTTP